MFPPVLKQQLLVSASTASGATASAYIDTLDYEFVTIGVNFTTVSATNGALTLKVAEADVTNTSSFADITALVGGGVGGFTIPNAPTNTNVPNNLQFDIDCRHRKRYLLLSVTPFTTLTVTAWATFAKPVSGPPAATADNLMARIAA